MQHRSLPFQKTETGTIAVSRLETAMQGWFLSGEIAQHSAATLAKRRLMASKLVWYLKHKNLTECGLNELRLFFAYLSDKKPIPGGRWGSIHQDQPVKPSTVATYHATLRALFTWMVQEGEIEASPFARIPVPTDRADQVNPFTSEQVNALLVAAQQSQQPRRNEALLLFMLDTGVRASELCALKFRDVDMTARSATVEGKGGKTRSVNFDKATTKALWQYLKTDGREPDEPLFMSERGGHLTREGLRLLYSRLGKAARISAARCSPHTMRHTFAVEFLRAGGNTFTLKNMLGHTDLKMTNRYVDLSQADIKNQHRQFSPVERLKGRGK